jgi:type IV secretion system protein VirB3
VADAERIAQDTLFLALTRPVMWLGVPVEGGIAIAFLSAAVLMATGSPLYAIAIGGSLFGVARLVVRRDPNMFRLLFMWGRTRLRARNRAHWLGSSYTPLPLDGMKRKGFARG